ncbi:lysine-sensitive aspartokinase 3 [Parashewanella tropica]|uniref:lysine-sensitive aspartokinase 3 n=1 Tax=Parashewanella tropica TaxID=2547970 RepID=UPI001059ED18|nr:lysine-sensitive aspartokinase 3 [Parashewanella tropica]
MPLVVAKFGGTSVANFSAMQNCAKIVVNNPDIRVVVVSAASGVTNRLVELTQPRVTDEDRSRIRKEIIDIHNEILSHIDAPTSVVETLEANHQRIEFLSEALVLDRSKIIIDELLSLGEQCSSLLFTEVMKLHTQQAALFDVRDVLVTDSQFGKAKPDIEAISAKVSSLMAPKVSDHVFVTQGFIGRDSEGRTTTLGRGGSDFSAALLAEALDSHSLEIWTDVAGIYTTDPRLVKTARPIAEISFDEAAEMATFGAKVLHPATILPAVRQDIQVFVGSSKMPEAGGTWIRKNAKSRPLYRAVAMRREQTLLNLFSLNMLHAQGFLAEIFATLAKHKISVDLITTSEVNVSLTLDKLGSESDEKELLSSALMDDLAKNCTVEVEKDLALIAVIGNGIPNHAGVMRNVFEALTDFNVRMTSQGASKHNLCILVDKTDADDVVKVLHQKLFDNVA